MRVPHSFFALFAKEGGDFDFKGEHHSIPEIHSPPHKSCDIQP